MTLLRKSNWPVMVLGVLLVAGTIAVFINLSKEPSAAEKMNPFCREWQEIVYYDDTYDETVAQYGSDSQQTLVGHPAYVRWQIDMGMKAPPPLPECWPKPEQPPPNER